jgi:hypothetical protein
MQNITTATGLKNAIELLEAEHAIKGQLLKEQFYLTCESMKPINILNRTLKEITSSQYLINNISGTIMGLASGYLSKKIFTGGSGNILRKLLGSILQFEVTNVVAKNSDIIKSVGLSIFQHFLQKKVMNSKNRVR